MDEDGGAAALPAQRMMALGPGGVAAAGGWSISLLFSRFEILATMVTMIVISVYSHVVFV
eukprot:scaffold14654_cov50-Cyclotella_meneghiniana.AAC.11